MLNPETIISPCTYCGSVNSTFYFDATDIFGNDYQLRCCADCGAIFLSPFPSEELLKEAYDQSYYGPTKQKFIFPLVEQAADYFRRRRAGKLVSMMPEHARILDIGCGNGDFLCYVRSYGDYELYGIERDENAAKRAMNKNSIHLKTTALMEGDFQENFFDAITLFHVFEHLTEPRQTLEIISKILKPGGILVISFPNINSYQAMLFKGKWFHLDPPRHLLFFKPKDFIRLLTKKNFSLVNSKYFSIEQNPYGWIQSIMNIFCSKREVLYERLKGNTQYAPEYGRLNVLLQKCFFVFGFPVFVMSNFIGSFFQKGATVKFIFKNNKP
ncbi:MAG TPA: class I SAM-dependent methyltransferase [Bacteroidales bacterium]|nr:class I SAM-dependent methyltransferase [Bacteroidales bacterium]